MFFGPGQRLVKQASINAADDERKIDDRHAAAVCGRLDVEMRFAVVIRIHRNLAVGQAFECGHAVI